LVRSPFVIWISVDAVRLLQLGLGPIFSRNGHPTGTCCASSRCDAGVVTGHQHPGDGEMPVGGGRMTAGMVRRL